MEEIDSYKLSADGENIIYLKEQSVSIMPSAGGEGKPVNMAGLKLWYDPVREWKQIFNEAWRMERDYYYEPGIARPGLEFHETEIREVGEQGIMPPGSDFYYR